MKNKHHIHDSILIRELERQYGFGVAGLTFIPMGDQGYSYKVNSSNGSHYFLKLFDHQTQQNNIAQLDYYLPLTRFLYDSNLFPHLTYPLRNYNGHFYCSMDQVTFALFNFIEGGSLAGAYPFSKEIIRSVAKAMAAVHQTTPLLTVKPIRTDSFDVAFVDQLKDHIAAVSAHGSKSAHITRLYKLLAPYLSIIQELASTVTVLKNHCHADAPNMVLCHGDLWGGNILVNNGQYFLIDWESALLAPPERDLFIYTGDEFAEFLYSYEKTLGKSISLNVDMLRFYWYRHHLRNLCQWMSGILYNHLPEAQLENDLDMIAFHCLNRLELVEPQLKNVKALLGER